MRIVQLTSQKILNGAAKAVLSLTTALAARGHEVTLIARPGAWIAGEALPKGVTLETIEMGVRWLDPSGVARVAELVRTTGAEILHSHGTTADRLAAKLYRQGQRGTVATAHARVLHPHWRFHDAVLYPSAYTRSWFEARWLVAPESGTVVANFLPVGQIAPCTAAERNAARQMFDLSEAALVLGMIGEVGSRKNQSAALPLLRCLTDRGLAAHLVLIGGSVGREADKIKMRAQQLGLSDRVHLLGFRVDAMALSAGFDAMVSTSRDEQGAIALIEGLARGLPQVSTPVGSAIDLLADTRAGLLFDSAQPEPAASFLARLAREASFRSATTQAARALFEAELTEDCVLPQMEAVYRRIAGRS